MTDNHATAGAPAEGTIKFTVSSHRKTGPLPLEEYAEVDEYRSRLWRLGLIGWSESAGYGYGNISARRSAGGLVISGTQTGHKPALDGSDYVIVDSWDFAANSVSCTGPCLPSSEALSHAALYGRAGINAVIHVHSRPLWLTLIRDGALSTEENIPYGSEALYRRLAELVAAIVELPFILVTKGHEDGVFAAGRDLAEAFGIVVEHFEKAAGRRA